MSVGTEPALRDPAERVSPRARLLWTLEALTPIPFVLGALLAGTVGWGWIDFSWLLLGAVLAALAAYVVVMPQWRYRVHRWEVTETAVYTQTGWWTRERRIAPMSRIQTVDYEEGALARAFRLATVTVTTASAAGALRIAGLDRDVARRLAADLTRSAEADAGDAT